ncbi:site-specific integrase [Amycolatopsis sp. NPDC051102]|uniref:tyrosine-type recombinase/integrase n=1 Tax=Amycolatopsis sp. NPDC051102 TaxID=3155163 RepID=UPI0034357928
MARSNGEGTYYQRKDGGGRWEAAAWFDTIDDRRKRRSFYGKTKEEARQKLIEAQAEALRGIRLPDRTWKLGDYLDYWLDHEVEKKRRFNTHRRYEPVVRLHIKPVLGQKSLHQLSVRMVEDAYSQLLAKDRSRNTLYQVKKVLRAALTHAMRKEYLLRNVAKLAEVPESYKPNEGQYWTTEEALAFLEAARSDPLYHAFILISLYGLRRGEVLGIRWRDVDFNKGVLSIRQQIQRIGKQLQEVPLKTESSERDEPLVQTAREVLIRQRSQQAAARLAAESKWGGKGSDDELVFTTRTGAPIEPRNLYRSFHRICEKNGIRRIKLHELRHTNATVLMNLEVSELDIKAVLGHSSVHTTRIYEHISLTNKRDALEKVDDHLFTGQFVEANSGSRQTLPSEKKKLHLIGEVLSGGPPGTRTQDTRLKRPIHAPLPDRITYINQVSRRRRQTWKLGCVTVNFAVNQAPANYSSWQNVCLHERPKAWSA